MSKGKNESLSTLRLSLSQLEEIREVMAERIREGLSGIDKEIRAIPTYIPPPSASGGQALVIDIGGTNVRAAVVSLTDSGEYRIRKGPAVSPFQSRWDSAEDFFDYQADLALSLDPPSALPAGYCFSYPTRVTPEKDAVLLHWTKDLEVPGVAGKKVGKLLRAALDRKGYRTAAITVLNDTVAALAGGSRTCSAPEFSDFIGLIVGTGTNMAAYFPVERIALEKCDRSRYHHGRMAVNLESGNFHPPHLTAFDDRLDQISGSPGRQRLEKAVSGRFLPRLYRFILEGGSEPPFPANRELVEEARNHPESEEGELALLLIERSADLTAAALAGLIEVLRPSGRVGILGEGGVINNDPPYRARIADRLGKLLNKKSASTILQLENVNLIGAASAALG